MSEIGNLSAAQKSEIIDKIKDIKNPPIKKGPNGVKVVLCDPVDKVELSTAKEASEKKASTGKKVGVGIANAFIPGLGQMINGQVGKGLGFMAGAIAAGVVFGPAAALAVGVVSIVDAVKNA